MPSHTCPRHSSSVLSDLSDSCVATFATGQPGPMKLIIGQMHRHGLALACSFSSLVGEQLPPRMVSSSRKARLRRMIWRCNHSDARESQLTLSSLELEQNVRPKRRISVVDAASYKSPAKVSSNRTKPVRPASPKSAVRKRTLEIDDSVFSAKTFGELGLPQSLVNRLEKNGMSAPTEVQSAAVATILQKHDVVIQSYTGSGKTLAYLLPIISELVPMRKSAEVENSEKKSGIEAVIVAPSRELGMQIVREVEKLLDSADKKLVQQLVGGANRSRQEEALKKNKPIIIVGTPGRIAEISVAGKLHTHGCRFLVFDEVDQLLSFNYREDMHRILEHVGRRSSGSHPSDVLGPLSRRSERQTIMVSATMPFSVIRAAKGWARDPVLVRANSVVSLDSLATIPSPDVSHPSNSVTQGAVGSLPPALDHYYCISKAQHKVDALRRCIHALDAKTVIVFMNSTKPIKDVVFKLEARGVKAAELHGDLSKLTRSTVLKKFKDGETRVLVTSELSARGLDVPECELVVNLELPTDSIHYAHRAGRTGRLGRKGSVVTICEEPEAFVVRKMRRQLSLAIRPCEFTEGRLVVHKEEDME